MTRSAEGVTSELTPAPFIARNHMHELDTQEPNVQVLAVGTDFYSAPQFNPANPSDFAYYSWSHPFMTWDHTQMYYNTLVITDSDITIASQTLLTGADKAHEESSNQPHFGSDGTLYFASDKTGFWNLYSYKARGMTSLTIYMQILVLAGPAWRFDDSSFYPLKSDPTTIASIYSLDGTDHLCVIDMKTKTLKDIPTEFTIIDSVLSSTQGSDDILLLGVGSYNLPHQYISYNLCTNTYNVLMKSSSVDVPNGYISKP
ncbi:Dipeptidyl aminopeptidase, partial [Haplosporangium bisporale]